MLSIEIFVCYHKKDEYINELGYLPIHLGASLTTFDKELVKDNTGENISELNMEFCELTASFWAWKNSNSDIVGINHYRRFFSQNSVDYNSKIYSFKRFIKTVLKCKLHTQKFWIEGHGINDLRKKILNQKSIEKIIIHKKKVIVPHKYYLNTSVRNHYDLAIGNEYISKLLEIVNRSNNNEFIQAFEISLSKTYLYPCNMLICNRMFFNEYCDFIFPFLFDHYDYYKIRNDKYYRIAGYLGELMTNAFIQYKKIKGIKFEELKIMHLNN